VFEGALADGGHRHAGRLDRFGEIVRQIDVDLRHLGST
jgi:hypothetical protein